MTYMNYNVKKLHDSIGMVYGEERRGQEWFRFSVTDALDVLIDDHEHPVLKMRRQPFEALMEFFLEATKQYDSVVPILVGKNFTEAWNLAGEAGIKVHSNDITPKFDFIGSPRNEDYIVVTQSVTPGTQLPRDTVVEIDVKFQKTAD